MVALSALVLVGCAISADVVQPSAFPFHADDAPFQLHWRLTQDPHLTRADGLIERRTSDVMDAWVQLIGLDETGRIVSFGTPVLVRWGSGWNGETFTVALLPRGGEARFSVRVQNFDYLEGGSRGRG